jgi:outer membrane protein TolC
MCNTFMRRGRAYRRVQVSLLLLLSTASVTFAGETARETQKPLEFTSPATPGGTYGRGASLQQLVAEALRNNPEIRAAQQEREAAAQRILPAGALDDPMLEAGVLNLPTRNFSFSREDMTMKMLGLSQRIPYPGKRELKRDIAAKDAESVGHAYQETQNRVARDVKSTYFDLALVQESSRLLEQNRAILAQLLKVVAGRYSVGQATQVDVLKAQTQLSRMSEELLKLERDRPMLEAELNRLLGRPAHTAAPIATLPPLDSAPPDYTPLPENAWTDRPQIRALQIMVSRSERALELAGKERYPDFDLRFSYGQRDNMPDGTRRSDLVSMTVAINLPVWRATKTAPRIAEAQALHEQALSLYEAQRNETATKLHHQAATAEQSLRAARLYRGEILPQSRLTFEAALSAYQVSRAELMPLLDTQMTIFSSEIGYATAVANYSKAQAEIEFLTGRAPDRADVHHGSTR